MAFSRATSDIITDSYVIKQRHEASLINFRREAEKTWYISLERCAKRGTISQKYRHSLNTIVLPNIDYALSVYAASDSDLTAVQCFLDRCF